MSNKTRRFASKDLIPLILTLLLTAAAVAIIATYEHIGNLTQEQKTVFVGLLTAILLLLALSVTVCNSQTAASM